jgi:hypothetical protein
MKMVSLIKAVHRQACAHWIELCMFGLLCVRFLSLTPTPANLTSSFILYPYLVSYDFGFGARFLIGSLVQLLPGDITLRTVWDIVVASTLLLIGLTSYLVGKVVRGTSGNAKYALLGMVGLYIASPLATQFLEITTFGRLELYLQILVLITVCLLKTRVSLFLTPLISIVCVAIYQNYVFLYLVPLGVILLYNALSASSRVEMRQRIVSLVLTGAGALAMFVLLQFDRFVRVSSAEEMLARIATYSKIRLDGTPLSLEYFTDMKSIIKTFILDLDGAYGWDLLATRFAISFAFFLPLIVLLACLWRRCIKTAKTPKDKWLYRLAAISPLSSLPTFALTVDYGRWICAVFFVHFVLVFYFCYKQDRIVLGALKHFYGLIVPKHLVWYFVGLLYFAGLGSIADVGVLKAVKLLAKVINRFIWSLLGAG